ncbi:MAK10-like protein [Tanacetum coccineum]
MVEMFGLLKELTARQTPEKVLIREEARHLVTKHVNFVSLIRVEEEKNVEGNVVVDENVIEPDRSDVAVPLKEVDKINGAKNRTDGEPVRSAKELVEAPSSQNVGYYLKHKINEKLIEGLVENHRFNDSMSTTREDIGGNFEIPCNVGGLKHIDALIDQGSDVNVMPLSIYNKLTDERHAETDIRLSLASHSNTCPLGIVEDVLVDVAGYMYPVDFIILYIKEDEKRPFILGTPFLTTAKAVIKFDKGTITLRSGKNKISFHRMPERLGKIEKGIKNSIEPITPTMIVNRLVLEWEERIKLHQEMEMKFDQWRSKNFNLEFPTPKKGECGLEDKRRSHVRGV